MRILGTAIFCLATSTAFAQGLLENPAPDSSQSGQGIISGRHVQAQSFSFAISSV
jgi:hypothetical protein